MYKAVIFDLDGTVADTLEDLASAVNHALTESGFDPYPVDDYRHFVGNGVDSLIRTVLKDHATDELMLRLKEEFRDYYAAHVLDHTKAYSGMAQLLKKLREENILTAVISNKPDRYVPKILEALYPDHRFDLQWGQREGIERKPAPDSLYQALEHFSLSPKDALYVGDSDVDVRFAHNAGLKVCGVEWGFRGREELLSSGADFIVKTPEELYPIIKES